uniref:C-type lectin n=1 Tax=Sinonovacula constricta TaxID=98310 RepID=A0A6B9KNU8_SINCO|nr:C-type lectin [Sinonovacula constricta]
MTRIFTLWLLLSVGVVHGQLSCEPGWTAQGATYCFWPSTVAMTWQTASDECYKMAAELVKVYTADDIAAISALSNSTTVTRWWTELNDIGHVGVWVWGRGSLTTQPIFDVINWSQHPDDTAHLQNCGALTFQGSVSDERCGDKNRYICEYTRAPGTGCLQSWTNYSSSCYLFPAGLGDPWSLLNWQDAKTKCATVLQGTSAAGMTSHLLFLETQDEVNYVHSQLPLVSLTSQIWWIGMGDVTTEGRFVWTDGRAVSNSIVTWAQEPDNLGGMEKCAAINRNGTFLDLNCNRTENFLCIKGQGDMGSTAALGCAPGWTRAGRYCYLLETHSQKSWPDANVACQNKAARLVKVDTLDKKTWIESQNSMFEGGLWYWTGLNRQDNSRWVWADNSPANMTLVKWNKEPNNYKGEENCAVIFQNGAFNDVSCTSLSTGYICEANTEDSPCPNGWLTRNDPDQSSCYFLSNDTATYDESKAKCTQMTFPLASYLLAINSQNELTFIQKTVKSTTGSVTSWFTGLVDIDHEGYWTYDTSFNNPPPANLIPWVSMPTFVDGDENCVAILFAGEYINTKCTQIKPFICEKLAYGLSNGGSRVLTAKFSASSVLVLLMYFLVYGLALHYILHLTIVLYPISS